MLVRDDGPLHTPASGSNATSDSTRVDADPTETALIMSAITAAKTLTIIGIGG